MAQHTPDFDAQFDVNKLLFFLHVPRTAGKTYANCFLRTALPPSQRCAKSYDVLRLNVSLPDCRFLVSHDDFSISQFFPPATATITQLRRPVERILSSYEFAVDVAAKGVTHLERPRKNPKRRADFVGTLEVWPWSILIPWFKRDMADRMERLRLATLQDGTAWRAFTSPDNRTYYWNEAKNSSVWVLPDPDPVLNPYNNSLVMPLAEFIEHPIAHELLHNGGALQVLGLTNYSYWAGAAALRACVRSNTIAREMLLTLAGRRLKRMAHVGLTERLAESVQSLAADLGISFNAPAYKYTSSSAFSYDADTGNDQDELTFQSVLEGGANVTLQRREAAERVARIVEEQREVKLALDELTPRLNQLVDREAAWLAEQDAAKVAEQAADSGVEDGGVAVHDQGRALGELAGNPESAESEEQQGAEVQGGAKAGEEEAAAAEEADAGYGQEEQVYADSDGGEVLDGNAEVADEETAGSLSDAGVAAGGEPGGVDTGAEAAADVGDEQQGRPGRAEAERINSPWAQEIEALDEEVSARQQRMRDLEAELVALQGSGLVTSADEATGHARQLIADEHYLLPNETLGQAYVRCAHAGRGPRRDRKKVYRHLRTPWGETFQFEPDSRALIPPEVTARIHQLNSLDEELWKQAHALLEERLKEQRAAGLLQEFPPHTAAPAQPQVQGGKRRKLHSASEVERGGVQPNATQVQDSSAELYAPPAAAAQPAAQPAAQAAVEQAAQAAKAAASVTAEAAERSQQAAVAAEAPAQASAEAARAATTAAELAAEAAEAPAGRAEAAADAALDAANNAAAGMATRRLEASAPAEVSETQDAADDVGSTTNDTTNAGHDSAHDSATTAADAVINASSQPVHDEL